MHAYLSAIRANVLSVYVACPVGAMWTPRYAKALSQINRAFPKATLLEPRHLFFDSQEWLAQWPSLLPSLGAIVFFAPEDNTIGAGVAREILDGLANRISVRFLDDAGHLHDRWRYEGVPNADRFRFVRVVAVVESEG